MHIVTTIDDARAACREIKVAGRTLGFVPTMGALHEGHLSLVRAARTQCDAVVVSIFVNPTQFGPAEDLAKYPRTFDADCRLLEAEGVELVFAPSPAEMYPAGASTFVVVEGVGDRLDGASRPGHFRGVATIVAKLFHVLSPDIAFFGQKDAAQVAVLRKMVRELNFELKMAVCPTVREPDGLAISSRNRYLSPQERQQALVLHSALDCVEQQVRAGVTASAALLHTAREVLTQELAVHLDYIAVVDPDTLEEIEDVRNGALVAVAAFVGATRMIDNLLLPSA